MRETIRKMEVSPIKIIISNTINIPIYEQIVNQIRDQVISGKLIAKEGLPSIRTLAKDLQVSVITTKRAYEELEREGVIESIPGRGFYVCEQNNDLIREKQMNNLENKFIELINEARSKGLSSEEIIGMVTVLCEEL